MSNITFFFSVKNKLKILYMLWQLWISEDANHVKKTFEHDEHVSGMNKSRKNM